MSEGKNYPNPKCERGARNWQKPSERNIHASGVSQMALTLLAERREPSGEWPLKDTKPAGWRPSATETQSKASAIGRQPPET